MVDFFFYGTLCHLPLLTRVLGRTVDATPATLPDHAVYWAKDHAFPLIVAEAGKTAASKKGMIFFTGVLSYSFLKLRRRFFH